MLPTISNRLPAMKTLRRYHKPEDTCFITNVTFDRAPILIENIDIFWKAVDNVKNQTPYEIPAWVIMPDHFHVIINPFGNDVSVLIQRIKMSFAAIYRKRYAVFSGRVWQNRFWDHIIRNEDDLHKHIVYIHFNPVKHGLVKSPFAWEHSSISQFYPRHEWQYDQWLVSRSNDGEFGE